MAAPPYVADALSDAHDLGQFASGQPELDQWLAEQARGVQARGTARTFVWHRGDDVVVAYYSLTAHLLQRAALGRGGPRQIPAVLVARLALDSALHGRGLGGTLLAEALDRILIATQIVAARFVVVDAIDEGAAGFYEHYGFRRIPNTLRLVQKLSDIAAALQP